MKLRFPRPREILGLFLAPTSIAHAIADLERAAARAKTVSEHATARAVRHAARRQALMREADIAHVHVHEADAEALRAARVARNLKSLVA